MTDCSGSPWLFLRRRAISYLAPLFRGVIPSRLAMTGPYASYAEALAQAIGYESPLVTQKVLEATTAVLEGRAAYERDGTAFAARPYLAIHQALRQVLTPQSTIADFGGGLGGLYLNAPELFPEGCRLLVIEQASMVAAGRQLARAHRLPLEFIDSSDHDIPQLDVLIFSSVLQYLPDPWAIIQRLLRISAPAAVILDRTVVSGSSRWYLQMNPGYYKEPVSYPVQVLERQRLMKMFADYRLASHWHNAFDPWRPEHIGMLLLRNPSPVEAV